MSLLALQRTEGAYDRVMSSERQCFLAIEMFIDAHATQKTDEFFTEIQQKINLDFISEISVQKVGLSDEVIASFKMVFFNNLLVTYFQGEECSFNLSFALGIISDLTEIFAKVKGSAKSAEVEKLPSSAH